METWESSEEDVEEEVETVRGRGSAGVERWRQGGAGAARECSGCGE